MIKRIFDILFSLFSLIILSPFFIIIALLIKIDSKGGIFFLQERVGYKSKIFKIIKFRSMYINCNNHNNLITIDNDQRITKIGMVLRKYKIDEIPQLINVLIGEMSLVGPRPEVSKFVKLYPKESIKTIFSVRPGITDLASLKYRYESELLSNNSNPEEYYINHILPEKVKLYKYYAKNNNFILDIFIILKTIISIF